MRGFPITSCFFSPHSTFRKSPPVSEFHEAEITLKPAVCGLQKISCWFYWFIRLVCLPQMKAFWKGELLRYTDAITVSFSLSGVICSLRFCFWILQVFANVTIFFKDATHKLEDYAEHRCSHLHVEPVYAIHADVFPIHFFSTLVMNGLIHCKWQWSLLGLQRETRKPWGFQPPPPRVCNCWGVTVFILSFFSVCFPASVHLSELSLSGAWLSDLQRQTIQHGWAQACSPRSWAQSPCLNVQRCNVTLICMVIRVQETVWGFWLSTGLLGGR